MNSNWRDMLSNDIPPVAAEQPNRSPGRPLAGGSNTAVIGPPAVGTGNPKMHNLGREDVSEDGPVSQKEQS